jgi:hypothetical protein
MWEINYRQDLILNTGYLLVKLPRLYIMELASTQKEFHLHAHLHPSQPKKNEMYLCHSSVSNMYQYDKYIYQNRTSVMTDHELAFLFHLK